jgi:hypothetical protein
MTSEALLALHYNFSEKLSAEAAACLAAQRLADELMAWGEGLDELSLTDSIEELVARAEALVPGEEKVFLVGVVPLVETVVDKNLRSHCKKIVRGLRDVTRFLNVTVCKHVQSRLGMQLAA